MLRMLVASADSVSHAVRGYSPSAASDRQRSSGELTTVRILYVQ